MGIFTKNSRVHGLLFIVLGAILATGCDNNERIDGKILDAFGEPLPDVTVKIGKTTFSAKTDSSGQYLLDYAPGTMRLTFSKDGYTTMDLRLDIQQKTHFPVETMYLFPIPIENGIFYIDVYERNLAKLDKNGNTEGVKREGYIFDKMNYFIHSPKNVPVINAGKSLFIVKEPYLTMLTTIYEGGHIFGGDTDKRNPIDYASLSIEEMSKYVGTGRLYESGFLMPTKKRIGKEKLLVKMVDLSPGLYSWVQMIDGKGWTQTLPKQGGSVFTFRVE